MNKDNIITMMNFLGADGFEVSANDLTLPKEAVFNNYRPTQTFTLKKNMTLVYRGWNGFHQLDITVADIEPPQAYLARAYINLINACRNKIKKQAETSDMDRLAFLLVKFNNLNFIVNRNDDSTNGKFC
jgi:hypothetical protein